MIPGEPRVELVVKRWVTGYKYKSVSGSWNPFEDSESSSVLRLSCSKRPENRRFEVISERKAPAGSIIVHTCRPNTSYQATTPWGELEIRKSALTSYDVSRAGIRIGTVKEKLGGRAVISFPLGDELNFKGSMLWYGHMEATTDIGIVAVKFENGERSGPNPNQRISLSREDYSLLPEKDRKAVVEGDFYVQWRISLFGSVPARDDDILGILALNICRSCLYQEYAASRGRI